MVIYVLNIYKLTNLKFQKDYIIVIHIMYLFIKILQDFIGILFDN